MPTTVHAVHSVQLDRSRHELAYTAETSVLSTLYCNTCQRCTLFKLTGPGVYCPSRPCMVDSNVDLHTSSDPRSYMQSSLRLLLLLPATNRRQLAQ